MCGIIIDCENVLRHSLEVCEGEEFFINFVFLCSEPHLNYIQLYQLLSLFFSAMILIHYSTTIDNGNGSGNGIVKGNNHEMIRNVFLPDAALSHIDSEIHKS